MRFQLSFLVVMAALASSWADDTITPDPATVPPVSVNPEKPMPSVSNLLQHRGISDTSGQIRLVLKFLTDPNMRNESANAANGFRQAAQDAYSCFRQKLKVELKDQQGIVVKIVDAMHKVTVPAMSTSDSDDILTMINPEIDILRQIWNDSEFQDAYGQLRQILMASGQEGMRCLRQTLKTIRNDVQWILGHALHTFHPSTTPAP